MSGYCREWNLSRGFRLMLYLTTVDLINVAFENPRQLEAAAKHAAHQAGAKGKARKLQTKNKGTRHPRAEPPSGLEGTNPEAEGSRGSQPAGPAQLPSPSSALKETTPPPPSASSSGTYEVPDRLTGRDSWRELQRLCPRREFNFVEVDVPYAEMLEHRAKVIELMRPQRTVMDLVSGFSCGRPACVKADR